MSHHKRLVTIRNLPTCYPGAEFSESGIRWLVFNKEDNGFDRCVCHVGRRILIDLDEFEAWLEDNQRAA